MKRRRRPLTPNLSVNVGASVVMALVPDHGADFLTARNAAEKALNVAKALGKARLRQAT
jgi:predicted signal transduction protein with EAL and GGDEF domain